MLDSKHADVTIHLGKGDHFFFTCIEGVSATWESSEYTDFCSKDTGIPALHPVYAQADNIRLTFKPLTCDHTGLDPADDALLAENCVDLDAGSPDLPTVYVNSALASFNVTNEATIENLNFIGNDNFAVYTSAPYDG